MNRRMFLRAVLGAAVVPLVPARASAPDGVAWGRWQRDSLVAGKGVPYRMVLTTIGGDARWHSPAAVSRYSQLALRELGSDEA